MTRTVNHKDAWRQKHSRRLKKITHQDKLFKNFTIVHDFSIKQTGHSSNEEYDEDLVILDLLDNDILDNIPWFDKTNVEITWLDKIWFDETRFDI